MSCAFSFDSRQIFSSGFDNKLTLWNTKGEQKAQSTEKNHQDCVTRIRFSPSAKNEYYASVGWDGRLKIWTKFFKCIASFKASPDPLNALSISQNGVYLATGGKDSQLKIWKLQAFEKPQ
jgi:guanine nucleotide-binding protein subunit beta-2-like 1 protein